MASNTSSWFAKRLGVEAPQLPQQHQPQQYQPQPYQPQQPQPQYQQPSPKPQVTVDNFKDVMNLWEGGEATKTELERCPKCHGNHFFSRSQGISRGPAPAPLCADCGYNGMFEQGDPGTWQA